MRAIWAWGILAVTALPVRADVVDSGNLQIGGQGVFGGSVTVQGNALGVNGSVTAASVTLTGTGAQSFALTTASGIHVTNGKVQLGQGSFIEWSDGSRSTTASSPSGGVTFASTYTLITANFTVLPTDLGVCRATATWTSVGGRGMVSFMGAVAGASSNPDMPKCSYLVNGDWPEPYLSSFSGDQRAIAWVRDAHIGSTELQFVDLRLSAFPTGSVSICLTCWRSSGSSATIYCKDGSNGPPCVMKVLEWK